MADIGRKRRRDSDGLPDGPSSYEEVLDFATHQVSQMLFNVGLVGARRGFEAPWAFCLAELWPCLLNKPYICAFCFPILGIAQGNLHALPDARCDHVSQCLW
jgi:hypothetical protein